MSLREKIGVFCCLVWFGYSIIFVIFFTACSVLAFLGGLEPWVTEWWRDYGLYAAFGWLPLLLLAKWGLGI